ncbi:MAG: alcohol dehydrogenase catalytic domain-containing protein, partial [Pseudomonadota bacterium]
MFNALIVEKDEESGKTSAAVQQISEDALPAGDVTVAVEYSTVNYKDGLCIGPGGGLVRTYPHVPGIDFAGTVEASDDARYSPGDKVVLTGWRVGEAHWGGYAQKARVKADWLVPLPEGLDTRQAMAIGTAGFTSMLAVMALEDHGLVKDAGPVLVTQICQNGGGHRSNTSGRTGYQHRARIFDQPMVFQCHNGQHRREPRCADGHG